MKSVTVEGLTFKLDPKQPVHKAMLADFATGVYEPTTWNLLKSSIQPHWNCVDVGAHIGVFTALMSRLGASVTAFEPHPKNRGHLLRTIRENGLSNVTVKKQCVAHESGLLRFSWNADNDGGHAIYDVRALPTNVKSRLNPKSQVVESVRLDDVLDGPIHCIKLDVEGAEFHALQGAERILREYHPMVVAEVNAPGLRLMGTCENDWRTWMRGLGYQEFALLDTVQRIEPDETASAAQMLDGKPVIPVWNILYR